MEGIRCLFKGGYYVDRRCSFREKVEMKVEMGFFINSNNLVIYDVGRSRVFKK